MALDSRDTPSRKDDLELQACLASTGQQLALLLLPAACSCADLGRAVLEECGERRPCAFHPISGGRFAEPATPVLKLGLQHGSTVDMVRCRPTSVLTTAADGTAKAFAANTGVCTLTLPHGPLAAHFGSYSPDGLRSLEVLKKTPVVEVRKVVTGKCLSILRGHLGPISAAVFSTQGFHAATASSDRTARVWNTRTGECLSVLSGHTGEVLDVTFATDGRQLVTASEDGTAKLWNMAAGAGVCLRTFKGHKWAVNSARLSPCGGYLVTASDDRTAKVWDIETGECLQTLEGHKSPVVEASFSRCWDPEALRNGARTEPEE